MMYPVHRGFSVEELKPGGVISTDMDGGVRWLGPRYLERPWVCWYCRHVQPLSEYRCDNCGGPRRMDDHPIMIVTNPAGVTW